VSISVHFDICCSGLQKYYLATTRELTRLDSITKAPVIHHFSETISGVMTIRSLRKQNVFSQGNVDRVNASIRMDFHNNGANEWLGFRLDYTGVIFLCIATLFMIFLPSAIVRPGIIPFIIFSFNKYHKQSLI
jgi:ATP-binding cassette, subfamily C (CFTR/MRP), member 2